MKSAASHPESSRESAPAISKTRRHATRASSAPRHCGSHVAAAYPYILRVEDAPQWYPAISTSRDSDIRKRIAPTLNLQLLSAFPAIAPAHRAIRYLRHTK